ncbi:MAG TPA: SNF2-related protein [Arthrobacter sp.]
MAPLTAVLTGTFRNPELRFEFGWGATLPNGKSAQDWVKGLPGRRFDRSEKTWYITGTGTHPDKFFAAARIPVDFSEAEGDLAGLDSLETLWRPMLKRSAKFPHMVFVRPRMAGYERLAAILGPGAVWDKNLQRFEVQLSDMITNDGQPKKGMQMDDAMIADAVASRQAEDIPESVRAAARELACSTGVDGDFQHELSPRAQELIDIVASHTGYLPKWFGLALYPFQLAGAYAIAGGHRALNDSPGLGKTRQALAAAAIVRARRTVIVVPPLVVENWCRETYAGLGPGLKRIQPVVTDVVVPIATTRKSKAKPKKAVKKPDFPDYIVPIRAGKKVPPFPNAGVIVVADSLLGSRPELLAELIAWDPNVALFDEVHRSRTWAGKRATANRNLASSINGMCVPMTGTPFLQNPAEGANMLAIGGLLDPVFGGASNFMERYTSQNHFGAFLPNRKMLPELEQTLTRQCWVRRNKADVLKQLPPKLRTTRYVDIDPKGFKAAHDTLYEKVTEWIDEQRELGARIDNEAIKLFARTRVDLITPLRSAAGVAKVPAAIEIISDWMEATTEIRNGKKVYTRPLTVWVHNQPVMQALVEAVEKAGIADTGFIDGGVAQHKRQLVADRLQNGEIGVIFCSIGAAGFGITLTASSDVLFIETDWTPANISQAEDRCVVEGQPVQTDRGPVPIEAISIGDTVLTHEGNWRPVTDVWSRGSRDNVGARKVITEVNFMGQRDPLAVTHDHEVWVRRANGIEEWAFASTVLPGDSMATPKMRLSGLDVQSVVFPDSCRRWTDAELKAWSSCKVCGSKNVIARGLCQEHYTALKRQHRLDFGAKTPLPILTERRPNGRYNPMPATVDLTPEFLSFCGLYVAEGFSTVDESKGAFVSISGHRNEEHVLRAHGEYLQRTFGFKFTIYKHNHNGIEMRIFSQDLAAWFLQMFGHRAQNKRFPAWVFDLSKPQLEQVFLGYMAGDGHAKLSDNGEKVVLSWTTVSESLSGQLGLIAAALGYRTGTRTIEGHFKEATSTVNAMTARDSYVTEYTDDAHEGPWIWRRVSMVTSRYARREERLWDLSVEGDESYVVGSAAVHNCNRIGQENICMVTTLLATNTLDAHMRAILRNKAKDLNVLMPGADNNVTTMTSVLNEQANAYEAITEEDLEMEKNFKSLGDIIEHIVLEILDTRGYALAA